LLQKEPEGRDLALWLRAALALVHRLCNKAPRANPFSMAFVAPFRNKVEPAWRSNNGHYLPVGI